VLSLKSRRKETSSWPIH